MNTEDFEREEKKERKEACGIFFASYYCPLSFMVLLLPTLKKKSMARRKKKILVKYEKGGYP